MKEVRACGGWDSPIGSGDLVRGALRLSAPRIEGGRLFWLEGRPSEGGRQVVMVGTLSPSGGLESTGEASPDGRNVRTRVHEYGGGEFAVWQDRLFFVDDDDGQIHGGRCAGPTRALTKGDGCYADLVPSPDGRWLVAIEELPQRQGEPQNRVVAVALEPSSCAAGFESEGPPHVVAEGHDFYASPCFSAASDRLAFLCWDHPNLPWNGTTLALLVWGAEGAGGEARAVAGGGDRVPVSATFRCEWGAVRRE